LGIPTVVLKKHSLKRKEKVKNRKYRKRFDLGYVSTWKIREKERTGEDHAAAMLRRNYNYFELFAVIEL